MTSPSLTRLPTLTFICVIFPAIGTSIISKAKSFNPLSFKTRLMRNFLGIIFYYRALRQLYFMKMVTVSFLSVSL